VDNCQAQMPERQNGTRFTELAPFLGLSCIRRRQKVLIHSRNWRQDKLRHAAPYTGTPYHGVPVSCHRMPPTACRCHARPCRRMVAHGSSCCRPLAACREVAQRSRALTQCAMWYHGEPCTGAGFHEVAWCSMHRRSMP
jgi:hypothetical protein